MRGVAFEEDLMDLSLPTRDMTDGELEQRVTSAMTRIDRCEELTVRLCTLSTAHRYILGAALEIQKERHDAAQELLPKEWRIPWHKARDTRIKKHLDDDCRALFRNAPSFEEAKEVPWPLAKKKWVRTGFSSRGGGKAVETANDERVREGDGADKGATRTGQEQSHALGGAQSETGTLPQDGAPLEREAQVGSGNRAGRENDLQKSFKKNLPKKRPPAYDRLSKEVKTVLGNSELTYDSGQVEELASLDPLVQEPIARMLVSREALSVGAAKVLILEELFLRPAAALRRALPGLGETALGELHKLHDELELATAKGSSNSDGQKNRVASSPAEVKSVEVSTPAPEKTEEKATAPYFVCGHLRGDWDTCSWGLESEEAAVAWLRQNYATTCQGMDEFYIICDDSKVMAALYATVKDGEWTFAPAELQPASWGW